MPVSDDESAEPLLGPLTEAQRLCLDVVGQVVQEHGDWPVFQYLEVQLDREGYDASATLASMPTMVSGTFSYGLVLAPPMPRDENKIQLTVAGLYRLPALRDAAQLYLNVIDGIARKSAQANYDPLKVVEVDIDGSALLTELGLRDDPRRPLLPGLVMNEPATTHGARSPSPQWHHYPTAFIHRFRGVEDVPDYLARVRAWRIPTSPTPTPTAPPPLALAAELDYLSVVWKSQFGSALVALPNAERVTRLAFEAHSQAEFDSRMSALREILKGFQVGDLKGGAGRIPEFLNGKLPEDSLTRIKDATDTLNAVRDVRDAAAHSEATTKAASQLRQLGLRFPITDYAEAWLSVTAYVINALRILREELQQSA